VDRLWNDKNHYSNINQEVVRKHMLIILWFMLEVVGSMCTIPPSVVEASKVMGK
jgi:hypothetical protein